MDTSLVEYVAVHNEQLTRARVDEIEDWLELFSHMSFWRRLRWLILGA